MGFTLDYRVISIYDILKIGNYQRTRYCLWSKPERRFDNQKNVLRQRCVTNAQNWVIPVIIMFRGHIKSPGKVFSFLNELLKLPAAEI